MTRKIQLIYQLSFFIMTLAIVSSLILMLDSFKISSSGGEFLVSGLKAVFGSNQNNLVAFNSNIILILPILLPIISGIVQLYFNSQTGIIIVITSSLLSIVTLLNAKTSITIFGETLKVNLLLSPFGILSLIIIIVLSLVSIYKLYLQY